MLRSFSRLRRYHTNVLDHFENPRNVGSLDRNHKNVGIGLVGAPACGDVIQLSICVEDDKIVEAKYKAFGCGSAQASSSYTTELVKDCRLEDALKITNKTIASYLKLPPVKLHCSLLAEEAIQAAIKDYKNKQNDNISIV